jgi:hypothetical protein
MGILVDGIEYTEKQIGQMAGKGILQFAQKNDPSSATATASSVLHGTSFTNSSQLGLFSRPGVRPERFSALMRPRSMARLLRPQKSVYENEIIEILTGQTTGSGNNATDWCAPGPLAGALKTCAQTYPFGRFKMNTRVVPLQEVGQRVNRADLDAIILNSPMPDNPLVPDIAYRFPRGQQDQLALEFFNLGIEMERQLEKELWQGVVGTDSGIRGWWKDMNSLSSLVKTGYADAYANGNPACPAADSTIVSWNADVAATVSGRSIVTAFSDLWYAMMDLAESVGMGDVEFGFFLRKEQFRALTQTWACTYLTSRCASSNAGQPILVTGEEQTRLREAMQNGRYLLIDGVEVPVYFTDGIPLEQLGGGAAKVLRSDAFLLPIRWNGRDLIRLEYKDMGNEDAQVLANMVYTSAMFLNNGMYLLTKNEKEGCIEFSLSSKMRLILEAPFLAARIDDISFTYQAPTRSADPGVTFNGYVNGGVSYRS